MIVESVLLLLVAVVVGKSITASSLKKVSPMAFLNYWNIFMFLSLMILIVTLEFDSDSGIFLSTFLLVAGLSALTRASRL
jgi:hypothetical protein